MPNPVLETALTLIGASLSVIPIRDQKRPALDSWKCYQTRLPAPEEWTAWVARRRCGLAIVLGAVSGNAEAIDVDDPFVLRPWYDLVETVAPGLVARLVIVQTPSNGRHLYYRCPVIEGNQQLALNARRQTMIETRGEGGYTLIPPSPAWCHPDHNEYVLRQGDLAAIPTITRDEPNTLLNCARALTRYVEPERVYTPRESSTAPGDRPGDLFAANVRWEDILLPHGWRVIGHRGEATLWCRPGKADGLSATTGHCGDHLYVFSSNAHPFEPERAYSKFTAHALLNADGDFVKAAAMLVVQGFVKAQDAQTNGYQSYRRYRSYPRHQGMMKGSVSHDYGIA